MAVIEQFRFKGKDHGLLMVLFPRLPILLAPFYEFVPQKRVIVISEDEHFNSYPTKEVIQVTSLADAPPLDTRLGFLRALASQGVKATDYQCKILLHDVDEDEFWYHAKIAVVLKCFPAIPEVKSEQHSTVLDLYKCLFHDFASAYQHYMNLRESRSAKSILSALMTMTQKARDLHRSGAHPYYRKILRDNGRYLPLFNLALYNYLLHPHKFSTKNDNAMLSMLYECSNFKDLPEDHFDGVPMDWILERSGCSEGEREKFLNRFGGSLM